jgi:hypothetical protein
MTLAEVQYSESTDDGVDVVVDRGASDNVTAEQHLAPGVDARPLPGDTAALQPCSGTGNSQCLGYSDPVAANRKAADGEHRIYGRNAAGVAVCEVYAKADGSIVIASLNDAPIEIRSKGPIIANSPDVRLGSGGRKLSGVGDIVIGSTRVLSSAPGAPAVPIPPVLPTTTGGIPVAAKIVSGIQGVTGGTGTGEE